MVLSLGKIVDYRLSFTTYNEVEEGGSIRIEFNKSINPEIVDANFYDAEDGTCCNPWI